MINESRVAAHAPGRVELLGNHTDYNEGYVLSGAIDRGVTIKGNRTDDAKISLNSATMDLSATADLGDIQPDKTWADYPLGVVKCLVEEGFPLGGFEAEISS